MQANQGQQQQQGGGLFPQWLTTFLRFLFMYYLMTSVISKFFGGQQTPTQAIFNSTTGNHTSLPPNFVQPNGTLVNAWLTQTPFSYKVYLSDSDKTIGKWLIWEETGLTYDYEESNNRYFNYTFNTPKYMQNNESLYAHIIINKGPYLNQPRSSLHRVHQLNVYAPRPKPKGKNLLSNNEVEEPVVVYDKNELISYFKPTMICNLIIDHNNYPPGSLPVEVVSLFNISAKEGKFYPTVYMNDFWVFKEHLIPLNETVEELTLQMSFYPMSMFKWQIQLQMEKSFEMQKSFGADDIADDFKRMVSETNPYLFGLTMVVSLLHTIFEFLAFKNDIQFWKNNKSMEGLSVRTITLHTICQMVIFLYLLDNDTSMMILASCGFGLLIEIWKIGKAMIVQVQWRGMIPVIKFENKKSYTSKTKQYDDMAMKYLSWLLIPLVLGTSVYSLVYHEYKNWYSFVLSSLVRTIYTFEFIMMTPQLFINYKLKSVSHLPWRVFMYRALNTFIDDLFAFIIKMPLMHRLSCLRDDIIFIVYLYQRWIYPVDPKRSHYGGDYDEDQDQDQDKKSIEQSSSTKDKKKENEDKVDKEEEKEDEEEVEEKPKEKTVRKRKSKKEE
ncbi:hypothetical protein DLAC_11294 [Tieghemostelium lacteum]|uniref:Cleft lip and palate associated transmembrane protein n=1 Tax=Tieghemostelium lacteum TaxID=361077 RepID=A0A151Z3L7_TIELA|nr:hypothetical protein DLAC_11294 [Tieghemostelium lacteum]|eukprot:KYQ88563.1 hypothetical protein DLAC_11294 [Tieghemostelium lacteum]